MPSGGISDRIVEQFVEHFISQFGKEIVQVVQTSETPEGRSATFGVQGLVFFFFFFFF